jgi:Heterokaryon incompatibility protein (HET)
MEHLLAPKEPIYPILEVTCLCRIDPEYTFGPFADFPSSRGFDKDEILLREFPGKTDEEVACFLQEWLFFALLTEVFGICKLPIRCTVFVHWNEDGTALITTAPLNGYIKAWAEHESRATQDEALVHLREVDTCVEEASLMIDRIWRPPSFYSPLGPESLSIFALCESLWHARNIIYQQSRAIWWRKHYLPGIRMRENGWCPNRVFILEFILTSSSLYFASMLKQPASASGSHALCDKERCRTNNIDRESYRPKHISPNCTCDFIGPNPDDLAHALDKGGFPLIRVSRSAGQVTPHLDVVDSPLESSPTYVALSHVWSDGLGNLHANALPTCQILHLSSLFSDLYPEEDESVLFWLDTICVPYCLDETGRRRVAIGRMRQSYRNADIVLVLDAELKASSSDCTSEELLMRITCSGWMRRLWTLQEGVLAQNLYFQFSECAIKLQLLASEVDRRAPENINPIAFDAVQCWAHFQKFEDMRKDRVAEVINALQWRNTSWQSDEPICLSILLNVDVERVAGAQPDDRMRIFLSIVESLPAHILFAPGERIQYEGYHWAPISLMPRVAYTIPLGDATPQAILGPLGLMVVFPGFLLSPRNIPCKDFAWFTVDNDPSLYRVVNWG